MPTQGPQRCQQGSCKHRPVGCQYLWGDWKQKGACPTVRNLHSSQTAIGQLPSAATFISRNRLALGVSKTSVSSKEETHTHFLPSSYPCPHFWLPRFPILIPKHVKQRQRVETEGTTLTTLWVVAFHLNCYLHRAWQPCEERGE